MIRTKTIILLTALLAVFSQVLPAQGRFTVKGKIVDDTGAPVTGASVIEQNSKNGAITDLNGNYAIQLSSGNAKVEVSCLGMVSQTIDVGGRKVIDIVLMTDTEALEGVVVTALGIKRDEKALGYAISAVSNEELTAAHEANIMSAMMGKVAGVDITTTTAGPTGSTRILIRGNSQLSGSNLPLFVVDGIPVDNQTIGEEPGKWGGYDYGDVMSSLNPDDIESISVLKGPSASALYGSSASNGVIMITTKSAAKKNRVGVEISSSVSIVNLLTQFDDYQRVYGMGRNGQAPVDLAGAMGIAQTSWGGKLDPNLETYIFNGETMTYGNRNNNILSFFQTGVTYSNSVSLSKATDTNSFRLSFSDNRSSDIVPNAHLNKSSIFFKGTQKFGKKLTAEVSATYSMEDVLNRPALSDAPNNIGNAIIGIAPNFDQKWLASKYKDENGRYYDWNGNAYRLNPYWVINEMQNCSDRNRLIGQAKLNWEILKGLNLSVRGGIDTYAFNALEFTPKTTPKVEDGELIQRYNNMFQSNLEAMLNYKKQFGKLDFNAFVGANLLQYSNDVVYIKAQKHVSPEVIDISGFETKNISHSLYRKEKRSLFGQVSLGWDNTYYIDATLRNDVSSTLAPANRSYWYPSVSGSVILSNMFEHGNWLSFAKIRGSWANVGGDTSPYQLDLLYGLKSMTLGSSSLGTATGTGAIPKYDIKPTSTNSWEAGLDLRFFAERLSLDVTYYKQNTTDQIMSMPVSVTTGRKTALINAGEIENKGVEITLGATPVKTGSLQWDLTATYSHNENMVISLHEQVENYELAAARWANAYIYAMEGQPYGAIVGKKILRAPDGSMLLNAQGMPQFEESVSVLGNGNYDHIIGLTSSLSFKNFKFTAVFDAKFGADVYSMSTMTAHANGTATATLEGRAEWYASEQQRMAENKSSAEWVPTGGYVAKGVQLGPVVDDVQTYVENTTPVNPQLYWQSFQDNSPEPFIMDASYVKLRELSLSYRIPKRITSVLRLESVTLSAYGRNLAILYKNINNIDPESTYNNGNGKGFEYGSLPSRRNFGFGINVKF
ncbi:MAG: SusC/RagA family TonB-linked outer membrane protein [Bacteroidales bacterium]|nr:SusC/RagA family TonB-linked outer membrane protein [Bacteroidales bacterium]